MRNKSTLTAQKILLASAMVAAATMLLSVFPSYAIFYDPIPDDHVDNSPFSGFVMQESQYEPDVKIWSTPVHFVPGQDFRVYAKVHDEFGEIQKALLEYSAINGPAESIKMELIDGTPQNGTYTGTIRHSPLGTMDITVSFRDNLGYGKIIEFREEIRKDINEPTISCRLSSNVTVSWEPVTVRCTTKDDWSGVAKVQLFGTGSGTSFFPLSDMVLTKVDGEATSDKPGFVHYWATEKTFESRNSYTPGQPGTYGKFNAVAFDYAGNKRQIDNPLGYLVKDEEESLAMNITVVDLDPSSMKLKADLAANGQVNNVKYGDKGLQDIYALKIETSYRHMPGGEGLPSSRIGFQGWDFVNLPINNAIPTRVTMPLEGRPWLFPFDTYSTDLNFSHSIKSSKVAIPIPDVKLDEPLQTHWKLSSSPGIVGGTTHIEFSRNPYAAAGLYLPLFGVFFLLGAVFILENNADQLTNKLAISIGVFAFIFAFTQIDDLKPSASGAPSVADMLIFSAAIATIAYGVSSAVSISKLNTRYEKLPVDGAMFIIISLVIGGLFVTQANYPPDIVVMMLLIIFIGLGYGLVLRFFFARYRVQTKESRIK